MAIIDITYKGTLLVVSVTGNISADEIVAVVTEHYPNGIVKDAIWDLTNGSLQSISRSGFQKIAKASFASVAGGARQGGKTAYVGSADVEFGLLRMYSAFAEMTGTHIKYNVFKSIEDAESWIGCGGDSSKPVSRDDATTQR